MSGVGVPVQAGDVVRASMAASKARGKDALKKPDRVSHAFRGAMFDVRAPPQHLSCHSLYVQSLLGFPL
jgi:hypothetical protein